MIMDEKLYQDVKELKSLIKESSEYKNFYFLNSQLSLNDDVLKQAFIVQTLNKQINDLYSLKTCNVENIEVLQRKLYEENLKLNNLPLVEEYNKAYAKLKNIYDKINKELIYPFNVKIEKK